MKTNLIIAILSLLLTQKVFAEAGPDLGNPPERILSCVTEGLPYLERILRKPGFVLKFKKSSLDNHLAAELPLGTPFTQPLEFFYVSRNGEYVCDNGKVKRPFRLVGGHSYVKNIDGSCGQSSQNKKACCEVLARDYFYNDPKNDLGIELPLACGRPL